MAEEICDLTMLMLMFKYVYCVEAHSKERGRNAGGLGVFFFLPLAFCVFTRSIERVKTALPTFTVRYLV